MSIKTIDIIGKEWTDKTYGVTYFSCQATTNYGLKDEKTYYIPFGNGYESAYEFEAMELASEEFKNSHLGATNFCRDNNIKLNSTIKKNCLKRDVKAWGLK